MKTMLYKAAGIAILVAGSSSAALAQYQSYGYQQPGYATPAPAYGYPPPPPPGYYGYPGYYGPR